MPNIFKIGLQPGSNQAYEGDKDYGPNNKGDQDIGKNNKGLIPKGIKGDKDIGTNNKGLIPKGIYLADKIEETNIYRTWINFEGTNEEYQVVF